MLNRGLNVPKWFDAELMRIERGIPRLKRTGHAPNLHGRAEAMLNEVDDFLMPDDIRWCPVDSSFVEPKVTPVKVKVKPVGKGIGGSNAAARDGETKSSMPPMASAAVHRKGNQSASEERNMFGRQRKFPSQKEADRPTRPGAGQKAAPRRARSKSVDRGQRKREDANVKAREAGRRPRPKSSSAPRASSAGDSSSQSKGQVPRAPPVSSAQPRPPVPPENGPVRPAKRKPQPPPKSAKAVLEGQLKAMQNRNKKNQEKIRATKAEFEKVRVEQKELEKKLYSDLREHLKSGEERRSRPKSSSNSRPTRPKTANSAFAKAATDDDDDVDSNESEEGDSKSRQQQPNQQTFERHVSTAASRNRSMQRCSNCKRVFRSVAALAMHRTTCDLAKQHGIEFNSNKGAQQAKVDDSDPVGRHRSGSSSGESNDSGARGMPEYDPQKDEEKGSTLDPEEEEKRRWQERFREWRGKKADGSSDGAAFAGKVPLNEFYMRNYGPWSSENYDGDEKKREATRKKAAAEAERIRVEKLRVQEEERTRKDLENDKMVLAMHAMRWKEFAAKAKQGKPIGYVDVPWLPTLSRHVSSSRKEKVELFDVIGVPENALEREKKAALRAASLRWHPDKFLQAYGKLLIDSDYERIMDQVNVMSQRINQLKARFDARGET